MPGGGVAAFFFSGISATTASVVSTFLRIEKRPGRTRLPGPARPRWFSADARYFVTLIEICFAFASSRFGRVTRSTPSLYSALIFSVSTTVGRVKERPKVP